MLKNLFILYLIIIQLDIYSQNEDFKEYYSNIKSAELELLNNNPKKATEIYHSVFKKYKEPFLRDVFVASQVAFYDNNETQFLEFIKMAFKQGMPLNAIGAADIFKKMVADKSLYAKVTKLYYENKNRNIKDQKLKDSMLFMFYSDQIIKNDKNKSEEYKEFTRKNIAFVIDYLKANKVFPGEKIIGISYENDIDLYIKSNHLVPIKKYRMGPNFTPIEIENPELVNNDTINFDLLSMPDELGLKDNFSYVFLYHSACDFYENKELFEKAVKNGTFHPYFYAFFIDQAHSIFNHPRYANNQCKVDKNELHGMKVNPFKPFSQEEIEIFNKNREKMFLHSFEIEKKKRAFAAKNGFNFIF